MSSATHELLRSGGRALPEHAAARVRVVGPLTAARGRPAGERSPEGHAPVMVHSRAAPLGIKLRHRLRLQVERSVSAGADAKGALMTKVEKSVEVAVPVGTAYNQWTQF